MPSSMMVPYPKLPLVAAHHADSSEQDVQDRHYLVVRIPVPYDLPPKHYDFTANDTCWTWNQLD
jgi:hypothetical protein